MPVVLGLQTISTLEGYISISIVINNYQSIYKPTFIKAQM